MPAFVRRRAGFAVIVGILAGLMASRGKVAFAADGNSSLTGCPRDGNPAVRGDDHFTQHIIAYGMEHSPTFAALVDALAATDIVVIVEPDPRLSLALNGYLAYMSTTPACRYVRVRFTTRVSLVRAVPIVGHELQHALEVASHPEVTDAPSMRRMYERYGHRSSSENAFESPDAERAGRVITEEMLHPAAAAAAAADADR